MKPNARELVEAIRQSLDERVMPVTEDKWAQSSLRSIRCLLEHLAARVELEGPMFFEDNADLRAVLHDVLAALEGTEAEPWRSAVERVRAVTTKAWREPGAYPSVESLAEENDALRDVVDALLHALHRHGDVLPAGAGTKAHELLRAYLNRQVDRERPLYMPAFMGSLF